MASGKSPAKGAASPQRRQQKPVILETANRFEILASEGSTTSTEAKKSVPSPVVLRNKSIWTQITTLMTNKQINFTEAKAIHDGIHVRPTTTEDHLRLTTLLDEVGTQYHTYLLPEGKPLKVVIRGVPESQTYAEVEDHLRQQGLPVISARRMNRQGKPMPLIFVILTKNDSRNVCAQNEDVLQTGDPCAPCGVARKTHNGHPMLSMPYTKPLQGHRDVRNKVCRQSSHDRLQHIKGPTRNLRKLQGQSPRKLPRLSKISSHPPIQPPLPSQTKFLHPKTKILSP